MKEILNLLWQVTQAQIGREEISHEAWDLQTCHYSDAPTPNLKHSFTNITTVSNVNSYHNKYSTSTTTHMHYIAQTIYKPPPNQ